MDQNGAHHLPFTVLLHLADLAVDQFALKAANAVDEEDAVKVVNLVQQGSREEFFPFDFKPLTMRILRFNLDPGCPRDFFANIRQA